MSRLSLWTLLDEAAYENHQTVGIVVGAHTFQNEIVRKMIFHAEFLFTSKFSILKMLAIDLSTLSHR